MPNRDITTLMSQSVTPWFSLLNPGFYLQTTNRSNQLGLYEADIIDRKKIKENHINHSSPKGVATTLKQFSPCCSKIRSNRVKLPHIPSSLSFALISAKKKKKKKEPTTFPAFKVGRFGIVRSCNPLCTPKFVYK